MTPEEICKINILTDGFIGISRKRGIELQKIMCELSGTSTGWVNFAKNFQTLIRGDFDVREIAYLGSLARQFLQEGASSAKQEPQQ